MQQIAYATAAARRMPSRLAYWRLSIDTACSLQTLLAWNDRWNVLITGRPISGTYYRPVNGHQHGCNNVQYCMV